MPASKEDFSRVHSVLTRAAAELQLRLAESELASISRLIAGTMGGKARFFHNPDHVIHVGSHGDAISVIAALFHDLVYLQVDEGIGGQVAVHLADSIEDTPNGRAVKMSLPPSAALVCEIFDIKPGTSLNKQQGVNEFLSALAAAHVLYTAAGPTLVAQILCCIELTIPFRGKDKSGRSAADQLCDRLQDADTQHGLRMGAHGCHQAVRRAVRLANQDVSSFGAAKGSEFLAHTWELVPETNPLLRAPGEATAQAFAHALFQMEGFFSNLAPSQVFQQFDGEPSDHDLESLQRHAARNIEEGRYYFRMKIVALAVTEAVGETIGKDLGLPVLLGELSNLATPKQKVERIFSQKAKDSGKNKGGLAHRILELLENPTPAESGPTLKSSPMAAFMLLEMGFEEMLRLWEPSAQYLRGKITSGELQMHVPASAHKHIQIAIESVVKRPSKTKKTKKAS